MCKKKDTEQLSLSTHCGINKLLFVTVLYILMKDMIEKAC
jgi:hypothetical protein